MVAAVGYYPRFRSFVPATGLPNVGGTVQFFAAGTATPLPVYSDATLTVPLANPLTLDANGEALFYTGAGVAYKLTVKDVSAALIWTEDNIVFGGSGVGSSASEWVQFAGTPTFISGNSFTEAGDQRATFAVGTRCKFVVTAGTVYGTIVTSVFGALTTVTLSMDSPGVLDAGLSVVSTGLLGVANPSAPSLANSAVNVAWNTSVVALATGVAIILGSASTAPNSVQFDVLGEFNTTTGIFTAKRSGIYRVSAIWQPTPTGVTYSPGSAQIDVLKNSANYVGPPGDFMTYVAGATGGANQAAVSKTVQCAAGDTIKVQGLISFSAGTIANGNGLICIEKIG